MVHVLINFYLYCTTAHFCYRHPFDATLRRGYWHTYIRAAVNACRSCRTVVTPYVMWKFTIYKHFVNQLCKCSGYVRLQRVHSSSADSYAEVTRYLPSHSVVYHRRHFRNCIPEVASRLRPSDCACRLWTVNVKEAFIPCSELRK